jgi:diguanylate cyclase (GGDEF)-like protein
VTNYLDDRIDGDRRPGALVELSLVGWPLIAAGVTIGVLVGQDAGRAHRLPAISRALSDAIARLLEPAAFTLSTALRVARAEALSFTDDLTRLYNRRYLNDALRRETKRAMRSGWPLSLLFVDLDGFKGLNDTHGHLLGNRALVEAADVMRACARDSDVLTRWGGDEFALLLPETGSEGALALAKRLRDRLERFTFLNGLASTNRITASIGVATLPDVADTAEGLLQAADAAMYRVKNSGKNGIHVAGTERARPVLAVDEQESR